MADLPSRRSELTPDQFELTPEHVKLLRAASIDWVGCDWGAPAVDCKRPYGGNGDLHRDMHRVLVGGEWDEAYGLPSDMTPGAWAEEIERLDKLHAETATALQVVLASGSFEPGVYEARAYRRDWRLVRPVDQLTAKAPSSGVDLAGHRYCTMRAVAGIGPLLSVCVVAEDVALGEGDELLAQDFAALAVAQMNRDRSARG